MKCAEMHKDTQEGCSTECYSDYLHETKGRQTNVWWFFCAVAAAKLAWMTLLHEKTKRVLAPGGLLFQVPPRSGYRMPLAESD